MSHDQDARYKDAVAAHGGALQRLARACEADPDRRRDLLQDMHVALWRSLAAYDARCSVRTWVYRVAHNVAATHVDRDRRKHRPSLSLDAIEDMPASDDTHGALEQRDAIERLHALIRQLKPPDRQIMTLYLEDLDAAAIAEITGLSPAVVATRTHRAKALLARMFREPVHAP